MCIRDSLLTVQVAHFRDRTLNDLPEFAGLNPSIEHFARIVGQALSRAIDAPNIHGLLVKLWENDIAWASYRARSPARVAMRSASAAESPGGTR